MMGCFSTCIPNSRRQKCPRRSTTMKTRPQNLEILEALQVTGLQRQLQYQEPNPVITVPDQWPTNLLSQYQDEERVKLNISGRRKVTFNLDVKIFEEEKISAADPEESNETMKGNGVNDEGDLDNHRQSDSSSMSSLFTYPPNYRYRDCRGNDDEKDGLLADDSEMDDDFHDDDSDDEDHAESEVRNEHILAIGSPKSSSADDSDVDKDFHDYDNANISEENKQVLAVEESSESLFSLSVDSRKKNHATEAGEEVNSPIPVFHGLPDGGLKGIELNLNNEVDESRNPVENIAHWKAVEAQARQVAASEYQAKENLKQYIDSNIPTTEEPDFKQSMKGRKLHSALRKCLSEDTAVDTSLSSWLVGTKVTLDARSDGSQRTGSFKDRPILGALTVEEIKHFSASSSPRSPSRSPDNMPIIGTVGAYWTNLDIYSDSGSFKGRKSSITSKCIDDKMVTWNSLPFETRLEIALQKGRAEA